MLKQDKYFIACFDNFDAEADESPRWIKDPAKMTPTERKTTEFFLPRTQWNQ